MAHVAYVLPDLGHYHHARLSAVVRATPHRTTVIEVFDQSGFAEFRHAGGGDFEVVTLQPGAGERQVDWKRARRSIRSSLDRVRPEVVCVHGWYHPTSWAALRWSVDRGVPTILFSESQEDDSDRACWREAVKRRLVCLSSAAVVGGRTHAEYLAALGMRRDQIRLGYDVVDNARFAAGAEHARRRAESERARLGLPRDYFLASARFVPPKNLPTLLAAYAMYRARVRPPAWDLVLLGDGPMRVELETIVARDGLGAAVHMPGFRPINDLPSYYGLAKAFVHASHTEPWGLVVNEAMAAGLPVLVSSPCGCRVELVEHGRNGFVFDPEHVEELAALLVRLTESPDELEAMGRASSQIISRWSPDRFAQSLDEAIEIAMRVKGRRGSVVDRLLLGLLSRR